MPPRPYWGLWEGSVRMSAGPIEIHYRVDCGGDKQFDIPVLLDPVTLERIVESPGTLPDWTLLSRHACACCKLPADAGAHCPAAVGLVDLVEHFGDMLSYTEAEVVVTTPQREMRTHTTVQRVLSSLVGLYMATSACPAMAFLKPMARFHLPFASRQETLFRAASSYMLMQYFLHQEGKPCDMEMRALQEDYLRVSQVNRNMAARLREAVHGDANVNAVVLLDLFAQDIPMAIDEGLADLAKLFRPVLDAQEKKELPGV